MLQSSPTRFHHQKLSVRRSVRAWSRLAFVVLALSLATGLYLSFARLPATRAGQGQSPQSEEPRKGAPVLVRQEKPYRQDVDRVLRRYDMLELEPDAIVQQVRENGALSIPTSEGSFDLKLVLHDMRSPDYKAEVTLDGGEVRSLGRPISRTYKGIVKGRDAQARFTIDENVVQGLIITPAQRYYVEPANRFSRSAARKDFVVYKESDLIETSYGECGLTLAEKVREREASVENKAITGLAQSGVEEELFSPARTVDIATEADFEFFTAMGGETGAILEINDIMNQVEGIYNFQFGLQFSLVFQHVWATAGDPYTSTAAGGQGGRLDQFADYWDSNYAFVGRDLAHMWTGIDFNGSTIGVAYLGGLDCPNGPLGYGMTQRITFAPGQQYLVSAHEIGHNFNADHAESQSACVDTIMAPALGPQTQPTFCPYSAAQIEAHANANVVCLSAILTPGCTYTLSSFGQAIGVGGGSGSVNITTTGSNCLWAANSAVTWVTVTSGSSGTNNGTVTFNVAPNTHGFSRSGIIRIAEQNFVITQAGASECVVTPISIGQAISANIASNDCQSSQRATNTFADQYSFSGTAGQQIRIELSTPSNLNFDTYLYLIGPNGNVVAENDDIDLGDILNSRIPNSDTGFFTLQETGAYRIEATTYDQNATTSYTLTFTSNSSPGTKLNQLINFGSLQNRTFGDPAFTVSASATSGLPVSFSATGQCSMSSPSTVQINGAGSCTITASQSGDANYNPAPNVSQSFTVLLAPQTITFAALPDKMFGDPDFQVTATASSGLPVTFNTFVECTLLPGNVVRLIGVGYCVVRASQAGNANYHSAPSVQHAFNIAKGNQAINFSTLDSKTYGDPIFNVNATATSGLPVSLSILSGPATIAGNTITITGGGVVTVRATQPGNEKYNAASPVDQSFTVKKADQTVNFGLLPSRTFADSPFSLNATASSGLGVTFQIESGPATVNGNSVTLTGTGTVTVKALQTGDSTYNPTSVSRSFLVTPANAGITLGSLSHVYDGTTKFASATTSPAGLSVSFEYKQNGIPVTPVNAGAYDVIATITNPNNQGSTTGTLVINKSTPVVTWPTPSSVAYGNPLTSAHLNATANVAGSFLYNAIPGTVLSIGTYQLSVVFIPNDGANYNTASASVQLVVFPSIAFTNSIYNVTENFHSVGFTVTRVDATTAGTVEYQTNDVIAARCDTVSSNASTKCDYATAGGILRFAVGETSKQINLSLIDDVFIETPETLSITLSNAVGLPLGPNVTANIVIHDNDVDPNVANPFLNNAFFVRMQYLDFLLREPDTAGFNDWLNVLNGCGPAQGGLGSPPGCDRVHVSSGFFRSTEFGEKGYWLYRFYESALGRRPQFAEFKSEIRRLSGQMTSAEQEARRADFIARFMALPEFNANFSGLTDSPSDAAALIAKLEQVGRVTLPASATTDPGQPPQYGRQQLIDLMANGQFTAAQTVRAFIEQKIVWDTYFYRAFVAMQYFGYLHRDPEPAGYDDWVRVLTFGDAPTGIQPGDYRHLIFGFVYSVEYRERFGRP